MVQKLKNWQSLETVERERERATFYTTTNLQAELSNKIENKQAKKISFINGIKKTDNKQHALKLKIKFLSVVQNIA